MVKIMAMPLNRKTYYTIDDWLAWDDDFRAEIIDGVLYMMAHPIQKHQEIVMEVSRQISNYLVGKRCKVFPGLGVNLSNLKKHNWKKDTIVVPDIVVVCDTSKLDGSVCNGAPDMVMEVLSPSTRKNDKLLKLEKYRKAKVNEIWISDPESRTVQVYVLENKRYTSHTYGPGDTISLSICDGCTVNLQPVFDIDDKLRAYIESQVIPSYESFDEAHNLDHVRQVINNSLEIAQYYPVDLNLVYTIAAYHDLGLIDGRANHETNSAKYLLEDKSLRHWFQTDDLFTMAEAIEDHRASATCGPRSIYGKIIADADNDLRYMSVLTRCIQYSIEKFPEYNKEEHFSRIVEHMHEKYGEDGYLTVWLNSEPDLLGLQEIRDKLAENGSSILRADFNKIYEEI